MSRPDLPHYGRRLPSAMQAWIPHSKKEALERFGNPLDFMKAGQEQPNNMWESLTLHTIMLPKPIPYLDGKVVKKARFHHKAAPWILAALRATDEAGLYDLLAPWGGSYNFRLRRTSGSLSAHAFGAAFDVNPAENPMREPIVGPLAETERGQQLVHLMEEFGWYWGGRFGDPMHFQFGCF